MPFSVDSGSVTRLDQSFRDRVLLRLHHGTALERIHQSGTVVVSTRHKRSASGRANRADIESVYRGSLASERVNMWSIEHGVSHGRQISIALVVGHDEDDVWPVVGKAIEQMKRKYRACFKVIGLGVVENCEN